MPRPYWGFKKAKNPEWEHFTNQSALLELNLPPFVLVMCLGNAQAASVHCGMHCEHQQVYSNGLV